LSVVLKNVNLTSCFYGHSLSFVRNKLLALDKTIVMAAAASVSSIHPLFIKWIIRFYQSAYWSISRCSKCTCTYI